MFKETPPYQATYVSRESVRTVLDRDPTWADLDKMAERGVFLSEAHHLYYDVNQSFREFEEAGAA